MKEVTETTTVILLPSDFIRNNWCFKRKNVIYWSGLSNKSYNQKSYWGEQQIFFRELNTPSLKKISNYANTCYRCCCTDSCYYCVIVDYIHEEYRDRRETNSMCLILHKKKNYCLCFVCPKDNKIHYFL